MFLLAGYISDRSRMTLKRRPTLIFAVSSLHLLMDAFLYFSLEDAGAGGLVVVGYLEDMRRIDPVVAATAHDMVAIDVELIYTVAVSVCADGDHGRLTGRSSMSRCR